MICAACGHDNPERAKFCLECGTPIAARCAGCGTELPPAAKFCLECGARTAAAPAPPNPPVGPRDAGSRKVVTILFADLAGSTALQERLDPESARAFMERYYRAMRTAVDSHGGTVVKLLGDGVMAAFGVPTVAEDDAMRAVRAGVAMQQAFRALAGEQTASEIGLRVAVNTGEVVVSSDDSDIVGDPVNVAARLQQEAGLGEVVIGEATQRLVAALVTLVPLGSFALKGRTEAVKAYRIESLERPATATAAAFVGRDDELARLTAVYDAAVAAPAARLAVLVGSPGLGKSRLIDELGRRLGTAAAVIEAQCDAGGGGTFAPIAAAMRQHLALDDAAAADSVRAAIDASLAPDDADRGRIASGVAALLAGSPASPEETFFAIRRFFAAIAATKPLVLVIDDLQWAEPLLLDLVEHLVQWGSGVPLLVLVGARPELRDTRSSLVTPGGLVADVVTLAGLDAGAATRLAANVIGATDLPAAVAAKLLATSEGNPLFVAELVRMLVQEGALTREGERWIVGAGLATLEMPPTIHALLAARIERLRPEERAVLERAAVVGRHFSRNAVAALMPHAAGDLDARLESLKRSELIEPDSGWFLGEPVLRFHHVLIRDAAYRRLLKGTRAELHGRLADWVEARAGDAVEHDETIGRHLEQAHQHLSELGPLDAAGRRLGERAAQRLAAAGRRALAGDDLPLAANLLGRAIAGLDEADPTRADLALDWCEALLAAGDVGPAAKAIELLAVPDGVAPSAPAESEPSPHVQPALEGAASAAPEERGVRGATQPAPQERRPPHVDGDARCQRLRAWHTCFTGQLTVLTAPQELQATADAVAAAAAEFETLGDAAGEAKAHQVHAQALARLGRVGACEAALDRALAAARKAGDRRRANAVLAGAPLAALWGPSPVTRASGRCLDVVRVLRITQGAPAVEAVALSCQGVLEALRGRTDAARRMIASSRKMVEELGITHRLFEVDAFVGRIELLEGDAVAGERSLRRAYEGLRDIGLGIDAAQAAALLARALLAQQRGEEAEALSRESEALAGDDLQAAIAWRGVRAEALAQRGEHAAAVELAQAAVAIASATDALLDHADARLALAAALRAAGRGAEADAEKRRATELWETKGATLLVERAQRDTTRVAPTARAASRLEPPRAPHRRVRANAATASATAFDAAFASGSVAAIEQAFINAASVRVVDHPTESTYGREGAIESYRRLLQLKDPVVRHEPLATLGESLALFRRRIAAGGSAAPGRFDVGAFEREEYVVIEPGVLIEIFAADQLGAAIARLYGRYAELLPEGPERERAAAGAELTAAVMLASGDLDRLAAVVAPDFEGIDHRHLSTWSVRGAEAYVEHLRALRQVADDVAFAQRDILALDPTALLTRVMHSGTERRGGGAYERPFLSLFATDAGGRLVRAEWFDDDRVDDALARFDALTTGTPPPPPARRVRPNAATAVIGRMEAAFAARDLEAVDALLGEAMASVDHQTGTAYGREGHLDSSRRMMRLPDLVFRLEPLATLGERLCLLRRLVSASGTAGGHFDVAEYEMEHVGVLELDATGRCRSFETFAADHLADAVGRLYQRAADALPEGPARTRAAAAARSIERMFLGLVDRDRLANPFSPTVEWVDHRVAGVGTLRGDAAVLAAVGAFLDLTVDGRWRLDEVLACSAEALLTRATNLGTDRGGGGAFERTIYALIVFDADGCVGRWETFDLDREAAAMARFDELAEARSPIVRRVRENMATAVGVRFDQAVAARDAEALADLLSERLEFVHHPTAATYGRRGMLTTWRSLFRAERLARRAQSLATLGDSLLLGRHVINAEGFAEGHLNAVGPIELEEIGLWEVDACGRALHMEVFAPNCLADGVARLYERYAESLPDGPARARALTTARFFAALAGPADLDAWAATVSPAVEMVDRRILGYGILRGADAGRELYRAMFELESFTLRFDDVLQAQPDATLFRTTTVGTARDGGGAYERPVLHLCVFGVDGLLARHEVFDCDREAEALARFDELAGRRPPAAASRLVANAATPFRERIDAAWHARDWRGLADLLASDYRFSDRRRLVQVDLDRDGWVEMTRRLGVMRSARAETDVLATRGNRLALWRVSIDVADGDVGPSHVEHLNLHEVNAAGDRLVSGARFDAGDLDAAYAELDARYAADPDVPHARVAIGVVRAIARRDWEGLAGLCSPTFVQHDHRRLAVLGTTRGGEAWTQNFRALVELAPDSTYRAEHVRSAPGGAVVVGGFQGTRDGGSFEIPNLVVMEVDGSGALARTDVYEPDQLDQALARFDALLAAAPTVPPFANAASRSIERNARCWVTRDWEGVLTILSPALRFDDRRRMMRLAIGYADFVAQFRMLFDQPASRWHETLVATRGERLCLTRASFEAEVAGGGAPLAFDEHLSLTEVDDDGRWIACTTFDLDDLDAASGELDARFEAGEGAAYPAHAVIMRAFVAAVASRDWDPVVALCAPTFVEYDHRGLAVLGTTRGGAAWAQNFRTLTELAPDTVYRVDHFRSAARGFCSAGTWHGTRDGGRYEIALIAVIELDAGGRMVRADIYDEAQSPQALARFAELAADTAAPQRFANAATATVNPVIACMGAHDWPGFARLFADDFHMSDRRRVVQLELDRDQYVAFTREVADRRAVRGVSELLATRGERLALGRSTFEFADTDVGPSEIAFLILTEVDDRGRIVAYVRWDVDDRDAAYAELDARWEAGEAAAHPLAAKWLAAYLRFFAARDWTAMTALFAPDLVGENHRLVSWGTRHGPAGVVSTLQAQIELAPDTRERVDHVRTCWNGVLVEYAWHGTREGGAFENLWLVLVELDAAGRACRADVWEAEQPEPAQARFAQLAASALAPTIPSSPRSGRFDGALDRRTERFPNAASRANDRFAAAWSAGDWATIEALHAPTCQLADHRRLMQMRLPGASNLAHLRLLFDVPRSRWRMTHLATRGERLGLARMLFEGDVDESGGALAIEYLAVGEVDDAGRFVAVELFDAEESDAAYAALDARYDAAEGRSASLANLRTHDRAFARRDWGAMAAGAGPSMAVYDHRLLGWGEVLADVDAYVRSQRALVELAPDVSERLTHAADLRAGPDRGSQPPRHPGRRHLRGCLSHRLGGGCARQASAHRRLRRRADRRGAGPLRGAVVERDARSAGGDRHG